jgi:hypothetical protein
VAPLHPAYLYLAALATPLVLSVHSVVSWDFAMSIVPGWHTTIFAPYFVAGAIFSGLAMVITLVIPIRKIFNLEAYFTPRHFDAMAKMVLVTGMVVFYAYLTEFFMAWYSFETPEREIFMNRVTGDYWWATWIMLTCNGIIPMLLWSRKVRVNIPGAVHDHDLHQHRHVVRALRDHRDVAGARVRAVAVAQLPAVAGSRWRSWPAASPGSSCGSCCSCGAAGGLGGGAEGSAAGAAARRGARARAWRSRTARSARAEDGR